MWNMKAPTPRSASKASHDRLIGGDRTGLSNHDIPPFLRTARKAENPADLAGA